MNTLESVQTILRRHLHESTNPLRPEATLESLAIDSLTLIEIMFEVEEHFNITVPAETSDTREQIKTVGDLVSHIDGLLEEQQLLSQGVEVAS